MSEYEKPIREFIYRKIKQENVKINVLNYPDIPYENREDPAWHRFRTAVGVDPVVILERDITP